MSAFACQVPRKAGERTLFSDSELVSSVFPVRAANTPSSVRLHGWSGLISSAHWLLIVFSRPDGEWLHAALITENTCFHSILHVLHLGPYTSLHSLQHKSQRSFQSHYHPCHLHTPRQFVAGTQSPDSDQQTATLVPSVHQSSRQH